MKKLIIQSFFLACLTMTACLNEDAPRDKTKDIIMSVSEEPGIMYDLFDDEGKYPMLCLRVMDEDFPGEWRNLSMAAIAGFDYQIGHLYTLKVRRTILANPPADASAYTYRLLAILEDRIWPEVPKEEEKIIVDREEDIPYAEHCPYHIYDLYKDAFVIDSKGELRYGDSDTALDMSFAAVHLEFAIEKSSPDFLEFNRVDKMAYYAYVLSPLTDKIEKVGLTRGTLYLKDVVTQELFDEIVAEYESGRRVEYGLVIANVRGYGLQKVHFSITKK